MPDLRDSQLRNGDPRDSDPRDYPSPVRHGEELDVGRLEPFLLRHFGDRAGTLTVQQFPNGHSNLTYLVRLGNREFVLRRPPLGTKVKSAHDMGREFRVLSKLHTAYPPAPEVLLFCDDESVLGAPFYLMKRISGIIIRKNLPQGISFAEQTARRLSEAFIDNLVHLHSLDYVAIGLGDLGKPDGYLERQVRGWIERYSNSKTHDLPEVTRISAWLNEYMPVSGVATLIHNDYKYDNLVLDPADITRITGVLDWEMATIGDPLTDLSTALAYWIDAKDPEELQRMRWCPSNEPGSLTRDQLVERYSRTTGCDVSNIVFYLAFARFKLAVIVQQIYFRYHLGLTKDARFAMMPEVVSALLRASLRGIESGAI